MQFSAAFLTLIASVAAIEPAALSALFSDLAVNSAQYLSYVEANPTADVQSLMAIANEYGSATNFGALTTAFPTSDFSAFMAGFPGASRVYSEMSAADAAADASSATTTVASTSASESESSASKSESSASKSESSASKSESSASTQAKSTTEATTTSATASATSATSATSTTATGGANANSALMLLPASLALYVFGFAL